MAHEKKWLTELLQEYDESISVGMFDEIVDMLKSEVHKVSVLRERLEGWNALVTAAHNNRDLLHPEKNAWPPDVKWIGHCLHTSSLPPTEVSSE